jgi:tricarballylate dehydrogenase
MKTEAFDTDVLVIGGGNAALCAALMAREAGSRVLLLESAPRAWRGGNSGHTRNLRCMHDARRTCWSKPIPKKSTGRTCSRSRAASPTSIWRAW